MAALPYIQFYPTDYLTDTAHLSTLEHGAYLLLIFNYWQRGECYRANDERTLNKRLASVARLSEQEWENVRETLAEFFETSLTEWRHLRIDEDLAAVLSKSKKSSNAGKASGARRRAIAEAKKSTEQTLNERSENVGTKAERNANHTDTDTDTDTEKKKKTSSSKKSTAGFDEFWLAYPNKSAKANAEKAFARINPNQDLLSTILSSLASAKQSRDWVKDGGQYIPHAATWLNGARWTDEYAPYSGGRYSKVDDDVFAGCI